MLIYKFLNSNNQVITVRIKLLDTKFVREWIDYMFALYNRVPKIHWYITKFANSERFFTEMQIIPFLSRLHASFLFFAKKKIGDFSPEINRIEFLFLNPEQITQKDLNIWHRHFTTLEGEYSLHPHKTPANTLTMDLYEYIHDVNQFTHKCEGFTYADCTRRRLYRNSPMYTVQFTNANHMSYFADNDNKLVWDGSTPRLPKGTFDFTKESTDHTVWLHEDIIGKDQIKTWLDHDDLTAFDVTGNDCMTPNVSFDPHKLYHRVIQNEEFRRESLASGKTLDRPPIGNIENLHEINFEDLLDSKLISIELYNRVLWSYN
jgi:hypothetical protein